MNDEPTGRWILRYARRAEKEIARLDAPMRRRVLAALSRLANEDRSLDVKRLTGSQQSRVRVGDMRVIIEFDHETGEIVIHRVVPRGRAYDR
ncbi:MAG: type II toxin-antitoxin system RelE/ParE family toxin [Solirubrobacterales bacterium]